MRYPFAWAFLRSERPSICKQNSTRTSERSLLSYHAFSNNLLISLSSNYLVLVVVLNFWIRVSSKSLASAYCLRRGSIRPQVLGRVPHSRKRTAEDQVTWVNSVSNFEHKRMARYVEQLYVFQVDCGLILRYPSGLPIFQFRVQSSISDCALGDWVLLWQSEIFYLAGHLVAMQWP